MKKIIILSLLSAQSLAQLPPNSQGDLLYKNNVKADIHTTNNKFWSNPTGFGLPGYEVPAGKGVHAMYSSCLWIGGLDPNGDLHLSANNSTYKFGTDFWPGPLDTTNISAFTASNSSSYNKLWKVDCDDITNFVAAFNTGSVQAYSYYPANDIITYPAISTSNFQQHMEPFVDIAGNGIYDPHNEGDYPVIKGHQQILSIYNDYNFNHTETMSQGMGLETHERSYAYSDPTVADSMQAINYSTFYHYTIYNRSNVSYHDVYISDWSDVDVGNYTNDCVGTDSVNNFAYCYNGTPTDPNLGPVKGYGNYPPVMSQVIVKTDCSSDGIDNNNDGTIDEQGERFILNRSTYYLGAGSPTILSVMMDPTDTAAHYYNYMRGFWKNNIPFTYGGNGYGGTIPCNYVFPGNPRTNSGWTESTAGNPPGDRRQLITSGPFNFPAGSRIEWEYALIFSQDTTQVINTITEFDSRVRPDVRNVMYYDQTHQAQQCAPSIALGIRQQTKKMSALVYPNPTSDFLTIDLNDNVKTAAVTLMDLSGRTLLSSSITNGYRGRLDLSNVEKGIYLVEISSGGSKTVEKILKN